MFWGHFEAILKLKEDSGTSFIFGTYNAVCCPAQSLIKGHGLFQIRYAERNYINTLFHIYKTKLPGFC